MFTCPNKDLHSLYLDGELPEEYRAEYEKHVNGCPKCQAELKKLRGLNAILQADSKNISLSGKDMDGSFDRLQARLSFKRVTRKPLEFSKAREVFKDVVIGAAAAAVIAVIMPVKNQSATPNVAAADFKPVARMTSFEMPTNLQLDGEVTPANAMSLLSDDSGRKEMTSLDQAHDSLAAAVMPFGTSLIRTAANTDSSVSFTSYDVFSPIEEQKVQEPVKKDSGFSLHFSSALFTLDIGKDK